MLNFFVFIHSNCNGSNNKEMSWSLVENTTVIAFENVEHITKWANEPWNPSVIKLLCSSDNKNVLVVTKGNGSFVIPTLFYVFIQQDSIYKLYAFSDSVVKVTGTLELDLVDDNVLLISDWKGQIGTLAIDFDKLSNTEEIMFLDRFIQKDEEQIIASNAPQKKPVKPYFSQKDYDCVVKGFIEERKDLAYFDGGYDLRGGAISAIKVRVQKTFGTIEAGESLWIYPDTSNLGQPVWIRNYGYRVPSGPYYFGLIRKGDKYIYRLNDANFVVRPEEDGSVVGDFYIIDKLTPPNSRKLSSEKFERKLSARYK